jgi:hypothetical protein
MFPFIDPDVLINKLDFSLKEVMTMHKKYNTKEQESIAENTRSREQKNFGDLQHVLDDLTGPPSRHNNVTSTVNSPPVMEEPTSADDAEKIKKPKSILPPVKFISGSEIPLDYPLESLTEVAFARAIVHHKISFSAPSAWFPGVPLDNDGSVCLHPFRADKLAGKNKGVNMVWAK